MKRSTKIITIITVFFLVIAIVITVITWIAYSKFIDKDSKKVDTFSFFLNWKYFPFVSDVVHPDVRPILLKLYFTQIALIVIAVIVWGVMFLSMTL